MSTARLTKKFNESAPIDIPGAKEKLAKNLQSENKKILKKFAPESLPSSLYVGSPKGFREYLSHKKLLAETDMYRESFKPILNGPKF